MSSELPPPRGEQFKSKNKKDSTLPLLHKCYGGWIGYKNLQPGYPGVLGAPPPGAQFATFAISSIAWAR